MMNAADKIFAWFWSMVILISSGIETTQKTIGVVFVLAFILVCTDFISGVSASIAEKRRARIYGVKMESRKMRWSFAKLAVYCSVLAFTLFVGHALSAVETSVGGDGQGTLLTALFCVKVEAWLICWIESVSIIENLKRVYPKFIFLEFIHYILAAEFVKRIPKLSEFLKEKDKKGVCEDFDNKRKDSELNGSE